MKISKLESNVFFYLKCHKFKSIDEIAKGMKKSKWKIRRVIKDFKKFGIVREYKHKSSGECRYTLTPIQVFEVFYEPVRREMEK